MTSAAEPRESTQRWQRVGSRYDRVESVPGNALDERGPLRDRREATQQGHAAPCAGFCPPIPRRDLRLPVDHCAVDLLGLLPPLLIRKIFDVAIVDSNGRYLNVLFVVMVSAAVAEALLSLVDRWLSSRIGEGLIFDLRVRLFDHVQRMPLAFFTRTQTGTLISRLNNDVIGAQRAFTGTLGAVVGN